VARPVRELKGFQRLAFAPTEVKREIALSRDDLKAITSPRVWPLPLSTDLGRASPLALAIKLTVTGSREDFIKPLAGSAAPF